MIWTEVNKTFEKLIFNLKLQLKKFNYLLQLKTKAGGKFKNVKSIFTFL